jgi:hypothetical protein
VTCGTPMRIRSVAVGDALYLRPYNGRSSRWHKAAMRQKAGRIAAAGMTKEVRFEPVDESLNNLVHDAYQAKYHGSIYLSPMISARAASATSRSFRMSLREQAMHFDDRTINICIFIPLRSITAILIVTRR